MKRITATSLTAIFLALLIPGIAAFAAQAEKNIEKADAH